MLHALMIDTEQTPCLLLNQALVQHIVIVPCVASPHEYGKCCSVMTSPACRAVLHNFGQCSQSRHGFAAVLEPPVHMCPCYRCAVLASGFLEANQMFIDEGINRKAQQICTLRLLFEAQMVNDHRGQLKTINVTA